jgi:outer membrane immunogenic protein
MRHPCIGAFGAALLLALGGAGAQAADLPPPVQPQPSAYNWGGFYFGGSIGGNITSNYNADTEGDTTFSFNNNNSGLVPITLDTGTGGVIGGLEAGYNYQYSAFVVGAEADINALQAGGSGSFTSFSTLMGSTFTTSASERLDYLATLRLRAGYTPFDRWLIYATGGLAVGGVSTSSHVVMNSAPANTWNGSYNETSLGFVLGGGLEYALTSNITLKGEYLYYDIGSRNTVATGDAAVQADPTLNALSYTSKTTTAGSILRVGANYKF